MSPLIVTAQAVSLDHRGAAENLTLFAEEVFPRLGELNCLF